MRKKLTGESWSKGDPKEEFYLPINLGVNQRFQRGILPVDHDKEVNYRRMCYTFIDEIAKKSGVQSVYPKLQPNVVPYCFPYFCDEDENRISIFEKEVLRLGFFCIPWPSLPSSIKSEKLESWYSDVKMVQFQW